MQLFDDIVRTYEGFKESRESIYQFLNRSARPEYEATRDLLEKWFRDYPEPYKINLSKEFRSKPDKQHLGAFFELYCYSLLRVQGFDIKPQQVVDKMKGNPVDFLIKSADTPLFYLEATVAADSDKASISQKILWQLYDALSTITEPNFLIEIHVELESTHNLPIKKMCSDLQRWLQKLDSNEIIRKRTALGHDDLPYCYYEHNGWKIVFYAFPRSLDSQGQANKTVVYQLSEARKVEAVNSLRDALETKAKRYGNFELPYVIAVDILATDSFGTDIGEILFGKEVILYDRQSEDFSLTRSPLLPDRPSEENGFWRARKRARNQQVSALLLVEDLMPWSIARKTPVLWHNPWAERPLDPNIWQGPQMRPNMDAPKPYMQERVGKKGHEIFHLQPGGAKI
jgi:hypothetical protein